jgi:hypothetical protein
VAEGRILRLHSANAAPFRSGCSQHEQRKSAVCTRLQHSSICQRGHQNRAAKVAVRFSSCPLDQATTPSATGEFSFLPRYTDCIEADKPSRLCLKNLTGGTDETTLGTEAPCRLPGDRAANSHNEQGQKEKCYDYKRRH